MGRPVDPVCRLVRRVRVRLFIRGWMGWTLRSMFVASVAALCWLILTRIFPQLGEPFWPIVAVLAASYPAGLAMAVLRRPTELDAALAADRAFGLRERVTTSLELAGISSPMAEAVRADARQKVRGASASRAVRLSIGPRARWVYAPLLALGLAYVFLPEIDLLNQRERKAEAEARRDTVAIQVERIREAMRPLEEEFTQAGAAPVQEITAELNKLAEQMSSGALTEKQAIAKLDDLAQKLDEQRRNLGEQGALPQLPADPQQFGAARDLAMAIQEGRLSDAAREMNELTQKLEDGTLSDAERKELSESLKKLSEATKADPSALSESLAAALANASASLGTGDLRAAAEAMKLGQMSLSDIESIMRQLDRMNVARAYLAEWKGDLMGPSEYCRFCGSKLNANAECENGQCQGHGHGLGLRGAGQGQGNRIGRVPEIEAGFQPTQAPGPLTKGKMLADLLQRSSPDTGQEATVEYLSGTFEQLEQEAEQALTQEEIPPGAKEFVRQYFGAIEPEKKQP